VCVLQVGAIDCPVGCRTARSMRVSNCDPRRPEMQSWCRWPQASGCSCRVVSAVWRGTLQHLPSVSLRCPLSVVRCPLSAVPLSLPVVCVSQYIRPYILIGSNWLSVARCRMPTNTSTSTSTSTDTDTDTPTLPTLPASPTYLTLPYSLHVKEVRKSIPHDHTIDK
jgi:hypothetical protein